MKRTIIILLIVIGCQSVVYSRPSVSESSESQFSTLNSKLSSLTLHEKVQLMKHASPAIPRLGIPAYNWWNEALHGVARTSEKVTVFPQAIGNAATFDIDALYRMADIISTEGRAIFNADFRAGKTGEIYRGLTYWTPNINIFRDPRWGRGQETYGEDPYLTCKMGSAMVRGLEGDDPRYLKAVACAKHFAVHSGPESTRHSFDARPSFYDLWDTYLPAFHELVTKAHVHGVMCAYNRLNGQPCCGNDPLLTRILRQQWGFTGYVTSDCWAISDFTDFHHTHTDELAATSDALLAGTDLECGNLYQLLEKDVQEGLISERDVDVSLSRLLTILAKLGLFSPQDSVPYAAIPRDSLDTPAHRQHARLMAQESMVLLKNDHQTLPLRADKIRRLFVIGPNADNPRAQLGNYNGTPSENITPLESLRRRFGDKIQIDYEQAIGLTDTLPKAPTLSSLLRRAGQADAILFIGGISADLEGEAGDAGKAPIDGFSGGDRTKLALPKVQQNLLKALKRVGRPLVLVNMSGSAISFEWEKRNVDAILQAWYGGEEAGNAIVDILFGDYNPAGRMPVTTYKSETDLPSFDDYSMSNRTYRYFKGEVGYPFGYGLSYTRFSYSPLAVDTVIPIGQNVEVSTTVKNIGKRDGDEVVQLYITHHPQNPQQQHPICALKGFRRIHLSAGTSQRVTFTLTPSELSLTDAQGNYLESPGTLTLSIGGGQPRYTKCSTQSLRLTGVLIKTNNR